MSLTPAAVGIGWECASSQHAGCHTAGCRCMCHYHPTTQAGNGIDRVSVPIERIPTPPHDADKVQAAIVQGVKCPKCGKVAGVSDKFCRQDGTRLPTEQYCGGCGVVVNPSDLYCANCGAPTSDQISTKSP